MAQANSQIALPNPTDVCSHRRRQLERIVRLAIQLLTSSVIVNAFTRRSMFRRAAVVGQRRYAVDRGGRVVGNRYRGEARYRQASKDVAIAGRQQRMRFG